VYTVLKSTLKPKQSLDLANPWIAHR